MIGYVLSKIAGVYAVTSLAASDPDTPLYEVADDGAPSLGLCALAILRDASGDYGWPGPVEVDAFVSGFFAEIAERRYGTRTLRASVVGDWIAARQRQQAVA